MKTVLITGASRGIGAETARLFAENGYKTLINYNKSENSAKALKAELLDKGYFADTVKADISDKSEVSAMFSYIEKNYGGVDILINNAGISKSGIITDLTENEWDALFSVNIKGVYLVTNSALKSMIDKKAGSIVNVSSIWGVTGASCEVAYSASKSAVIGYTKALAKEVGLSGIRVNCVCPGVIDTAMNANLSKETLAELAGETSLNRLGKPREVAEAIYFLALDKASFITGQTLTVDGGFIL